MDIDTEMKAVADVPQFAPPAKAPQNAPTTEAQPKPVGGDNAGGILEHPAVEATVGAAVAVAEGATGAGVFDAAANGVVSSALAPAVGDLVTGRIRSLESPPPSLDEIAKTSEATSPVAGVATEKAIEAGKEAIAPEVDADKQPSSPTATNGSATPSAEKPATPGAQAPTEAAPPAGDLTQLLQDVQAMKDVLLGAQQVKAASPEINEQDAAKMRAVLEQREVVSHAGERDISRERAALEQDKQERAHKQVSAEAQAQGQNAAAQSQLTQHAGTATAVEGTANVVGMALGVAAGAVKGVGVGLAKTVEAVGSVVGSMDRAAESVVDTAMHVGKTGVSVTGKLAGGAASMVVEAGKGLYEGATGGRAVAVLPRLSEYRVAQTEKTASAYADASEQLWRAGNLPSVRKEIEERARVTGLSVPDVMEKMKPNGEMADLHSKFAAAVAESPEAQKSKKAMDKALESWGRQYGQAQKELLSPETHGNAHYDTLSDRLEKSQGKMNEATKKIPAFEGEESHAEKMQEMVRRIAEKIKEMLAALTRGLTGKREATNDSPAP